MASKLFVDLDKCRECKDCTIKCSYFYHPDNLGTMFLVPKPSGAWPRAMPNPPLPRGATSRGAGASSGRSHPRLPAQARSSPLRKQGVVRVADAQ